MRDDRRKYRRRDAPPRSPCLTDIAQTFRRRRSFGGPPEPWRRLVRSCCERLLLELEVHRDSHGDRDRDSIQQRRHERPLPDGIERRLIEQSDRAQDASRLDVPPTVDGRLDDDHALYA